VSWPVCALLNGADPEGTSSLVLDLLHSPPDDVGGTSTRRRRRVDHAHFVTRHGDGPLLFGTVPVGKTAGFDLHREAAVGVADAVLAVRSRASPKPSFALLRSRGHPIVRRDLRKSARNRMWLKFPLASQVAIPSDSCERLVLFPPCSRTTFTSVQCRRSAAASRHLSTGLRRRMFQLG